MRVLIASCQALLRRSLVAELLAAEHDVRALSTSTAEDWPAQVEPWLVKDSAGLDQAVADREALIYVDPQVGGQSVDGTDILATADEVLRASSRMSVPRVLLVRLRAPEPAMHPNEASHSDQDRPTRIDIRTTPIYGTGTDAISLLFIMMRSLPVVPLLSTSHAIQPLWHQDLGRAIAAIVSRNITTRTPLEISGAETVTYDDLYDRIARLIDRRPVRVAIPDFLALHAAKLADALGLPVPFDSSHLSLDSATDPLPAGENALVNVLGLTPTPLDAGLNCMIQQLDELTPAQGVGRIEVKRFFADIRDSPLGAEPLMREFRSRFADVMPVDVGVEPAASQVVLSPGAVLTLALPGRGHVQIRVEEVTDAHVVVATLRGHALAGIVRFRVEPRGECLRFEVLTCDAAANALDWIALTLGGARIQDGNWTVVVQNVVRLAGGTAGEVQSDHHRLSSDEAQIVERWIKGIIDRQRTSA